MLGWTPPECPRVYPRYISLEYSREHFGCVSIQAHPFKHGNNDWRSEAVRMNRKWTVEQRLALPARLAQAALRNIVVLYILLKVFLRIFITLIRDSCFFIIISGAVLSAPLPLLA